MYQRLFVLSSVSAMAAALLFSPIASAQDETMFVESAVEAGIQGIENRLEYGAAWGDITGNGYDDLFIAAHPANLLYINNGDGTFTEAAAQAGVQDLEMLANGAAWGDFNGDGLLDLFVCNLASAHDEPAKNRLFRNNGDGTFTDVAEAAGVTGLELLHEDEHEDEFSGGSISAAWGDFDNDGHLDLIVSNRNVGVFLYRNQGDGTFELVSEDAGLPIADDHDDEGIEVDDDHDEFTVGVEHAAWADYNENGYLDLFLSVAVVEEHDDEDHNGEEDDHEDERILTRNYLFRNNGDGTFTDVTETAGLYDPNYAVTHSAVWGDYNNNGLLDLFVCNLGSVNLGTAVPSKLYRNNGDGTFTDVTEEAGIGEQYYLISAAWADLNNDGWLDLVAIHHPAHDDFEAGEFYEVPHPIYINNGDGTFTNINAEPVDAILDTGVTDINHLIGLTVADYNGDGAIDILMTENHADGPLLLYRNQHAAQLGNWLKIGLSQDGTNPFAFGAEIALHAESGSQVRHVGAVSTGFGSQSSITPHFGLGDETLARVIVTWPDGAWEDFGLLEAGESYTLIRGEGEETSVAEWQMY